LPVSDFPSLFAASPRIVFEDPYVKSTKSETVAGLDLVFPRFEASSLAALIPALKARAGEVFARLSLPEMQKVMDRLDSYFTALGSPEIQAIVDLIHRIDGFSRHDIERFGLGIFSPLVQYDRSLIGRFVEQAFGTRRPVETAFGYLKRFGRNSPLTRWREPGLLSHFVSGNVVGYSAILTRIGLPVKDGGAAQIIKLPSTSAVFPMIYLKKMAEFAPLVRETMACGYWKGGDRELEGIVLAHSDVVNVLGSEATVRDVTDRARLRRPRPTILAHGHKIGAAYISRAFAEAPDLRQKAVEGLVRDISAFDGAACYCTKNIYVQGDHRAFAGELADSLIRFALEISPVNPAMKPVGRELARIFHGASNVIVSPEENAVVRISNRPEFWLPDETFRYVQVMPAESSEAVAGVLKTARPFLQTVVAAVPDEEILGTLELFGAAGASNIHYPGSAPLLNVFEEPHDGDFDAIKARYPYASRFAATNFKKNSDWLP
jgi:hypothetical protein